MGGKMRSEQTWKSAALALFSRLLSPSPSLFLLLLSSTFGLCLPPLESGGVSSTTFLFPLFLSIVHFSNIEVLPPVIIFPPSFGTTVASHSFTQLVSFPHDCCQYLIVLVSHTAQLSSVTLSAGSHSLAAIAPHIVSDLQPERNQEESKEK
ncbi:uncharacterized protein LY79DRAFT_256919 [Colletotrichum navitas]|uniref:Uncharacterized protein n=1 Tax=Colletotrichum navitas TaxID=681940 RepID=A0AAD8QBT8_9PEZI|nr:uncharacterized protein LY79DRAFT_256919 [Colletotrichum navitas]KAK1598797.1 hypothetical protein LY79DRAFT_256919 [Colletotrichum navitas]